MSLPQLDGIDPATEPDPLDPDARAELDLLFDERIARCWRAPMGFLVMTNLRCTYLWHRLLVLRGSDWQEGPTFFFYNLAAPRIVAQRFVELREEGSMHPRAFRFLVKDPAAVCAEIEATMPAGRAEWRARKARAQVRDSPMDGVARAPRTTVVVRQVVKIRCRYCGNLMDETAAVCPACGAPPG